MKKTILFFFLGMLLALTTNNNCKAQDIDPFDTFEKGQQSTQSNSNASDAGKSADELISEALKLQAEEKLLDYRSKLLTLIRRYPENLMGHILLSEYYLRHVGHFRLSYRYAKRAEELFYQQQGKPPYLTNYYAKALHTSLLGLISDIRLNLDDYQGALAAIEEIEKFNYFEYHLPSSKAWILMKLKRIDEAINVAKAGLLLGSAPGHTLNVLGILLSISDRREESIKTFQEAIEYEFSLGSSGNPATPLNNVGEVFREIFQEARAIESWESSVRLPDGCEHVLPSMNLAVVHIDNLDLAEARSVLENFASCFAKYPLKNEEEHKALIHLAKGRIALYAGYVDDAIDNFNIALNKQQWFGKIGTSREDLEAAIRISLALALKAKNQHLANSYNWSLKEGLQKKITRIKNLANFYWQLRKARLLLFDHLNQFEDLYVRHSDSMLDYASLGISIANLNSKLAKKLIDRELASDRRPHAKFFYDAYLAENLLTKGSKQAAQEILTNVLQNCRSPYDNALKSRVLQLLAKTHKKGSAEYFATTLNLFKLSPAAIRNAGLLVPVKDLGLSSEAKKILSSYNFIFNNNSSLGIKFDSENTFRLELHDLNRNNLISFVQGSKKEDIFRDFIEAVFYQQY